MRNICARDARDMSGFYGRPPSGGLFRFKNLTGQSQLSCGGAGQDSGGHCFCDRAHVFTCLFLSRGLAQSLPLDSKKNPAAGNWSVPGERGLMVAPGRPAPWHRHLAVVGCWRLLQHRRSNVGIGRVCSFQKRGLSPVGHGLELCAHRRSGPRRPRPCCQSAPPFLSETNRMISIGLVSQPQMQGLHSKS